MSTPLVSSPDVGAGGPTAEAFVAGFDGVRRELDIIEEFSAEALDQAARPKLRTDRPGAELDRRDIHLVTIDPPSSMDLDQAFHAERTPSGYRVHYAIADPGAFIVPGSALDVATRARGVTMYAPDRNTPLHPRVLSEGSASLLAGQDRPSVLWTIELDGEGHPTATHLERAVVRSREKLSYAEAQRRIDADQGASIDALRLLREIGELRETLERDRGGVSLNLPSQEVVAAGAGYQLRYDKGLHVEDWNAQISLLTGMAAADRMLDAGVGLLRTLPEPSADSLRQIRRHGLALGVQWPSDVSYQDRVRVLDPAVPEHAALLAFAVRALRGAGYLAFEGPTDESTVHWAIAADYAHVTAPLRRIGDRFANEILLAICAEETPPAWAVEGAAEMPEVLGAARRKERALDRAIVDFAEALVLESRIGEVFDAVVTTERRDGQVTIQLREPAVAALLDAEVEPGEEIRVRVAEADPVRRRVRFELP